MRKSLVVGILPESKDIWERRAPLSPKDVAWLVEKKIQVEVVTSPLRIFKDLQYQRSGAKIVKSFKKANFLIGIKEPPIDTLIPDSVYMVFSHTTKGQKYNRNLLTTFLKKKITLIDYEHITGSLGQRLVYFGRYAGICGMIDTLYVFGRRAKLQGISSPFSDMKSAVQYGTYNAAKKALNQVAEKINKIGFNRNMNPLVIGILGHGNVSQGAQEVIEHLGAVDIHPKDIDVLARNRTSHKKTIYKLIFKREEKLRSKKGNNFYFEEYLKHPKRYESNLDKYLPFLNILINSSYWDKRYPRLLSEKMLQNLYLTNPDFCLSVIGDLSCDIKGTIEITKKATTPSEPAFVYDPASRKISSDLSYKGIAVMAIDNLPCEFPKESSLEFAKQVREFIYQIAAHGINDITNHHGISNVIRNAVITQNGKLTSRFKYLNKYF
jgi:saccharopine dehydrogenase (NAD+, L-lysine-forming)